MRFPDLIRLALANLRRNGTRSVMTLVGVMIGVAALMTLLAYGNGVQQNARSEFNALELYNTLRVTSRPNPFDTFGSPLPARAQLDTMPLVPLTDSLLAAIEGIDGVLAAYPEVVFPVEIVANGHETVATAEAVPMAFAAMPSYQPTDGAFFAAPTDSSVLLAPSMARRLGYEEPSRIVGQRVTLKTLSLDFRMVQQLGPALAMGLTNLPFHSHQTPMRVAGLLPEKDQVVTGVLRIVVPLERAKTLRKVTFFSTMDLLIRNGSTDGYAAARIQLADVDVHEAVVQAIEAKGVFVNSLRDRFAQLERLFVIMDLALGIIGVIALLVATIGIANTMMMNVMERTREIGVMKAVGGDEGDLQKLFVVESGTLGLLGGVAGLLLGWGLVALIQLGVDVYMQRLGIAPISAFHIAPLTLLGILAVALVVSLLAGIVPARRAARIEPIAALRSV